MRARGISLLGVLLVAVSGCAEVRAGAPRTAAQGVVAQHVPREAAGTGGELSGEARARLDRTLGRYVKGRPGRVAVAVYDRTAGVRYAFRDREPFMLASVAKVDILLALLLRRQREHRKLDAYERTLAARMIRYSDNDCAHELYLTIGGRRGLAGMLRAQGVRHTTPGSGLYWGATMSRPSDQVRVLERLTDPAGPVSAANRRYALGLMSSVEPSQAWGVSAAGERAALKNGWLPADAHDGLWTVNSVGRLVVHGHELLVAVLSERSPTMATGVATVEHVAKLAVRAVTASAL
ncbi:serine hydrolase [Nonomuraea sp. SBT364]|uniref:serine hydrolase n=1 Tax=Nonomuraea sp. SBT364 TaxID=1580530 RepID=UPI00066B9129|nr:serine hydrolase [Nonomuraea sp. SBT364]